MRPLGDVAVDEVVELGPLLQKVLSGRLGGSTDTNDIPWVFYNSDSRAAPTRLTSEHRRAAAQDRRVMAVHDAEVGDGAHRFGMGQCQGKSRPIGQLPAPVGDALAPLLGT